MIKTKIIKTQIPVIFLDTFFFIDLVGNRHKPIKSAHYQEELELIELIHKLTKQSKLLCPTGDQSEEYELGIKYEDELRKEQTRLSYGLRVMYHWGVKKYQTKIAMNAYIKGVSTIEYNYRSLFIKDPIQELREALSSEFLVHVHHPMKKEFLDKQRKTKRELALEFEILRLKKIRSRVVFKDCVRDEKLGILNVIDRVIKTTFPKVKQNLVLTEEDINAWMTLGDFLAPFTRYAERDATIQDIVKFIKSDYYSNIPYVDIQSRLYASLLTQPNKVKESDNFDFDQVSQMLPFSTYFVTDSALKHRLTSSPLNLDKEFGVKIYSMKEINSLIEELKKI